jgi:hypothetical protein
VNDAVITGNKAGGLASSTGGGGVGVIGTALGTTQQLTLNRVTVSNNQTVAFGGAQFPGGGLYAAGPTTINDSTFSGNATGTSVGGGVYANKIVAGDTASVIVDHSTITTNTATIGAGLAVTFGATLTVRNSSTVANNTAASGGGLYSAGASTITNSTLSGNTASFQGGGIYDGSTVATDTPSVTLTDTVLNGNTANNNAGGAALVANKSTFTMTRGSITGGTAAFGAGLFVVRGGTASLTDTNVNGNTANATAAASTGTGGGIYNQGTTSIAGGTVSTNTANGGAAVNGGNGGGIFDTGALNVTGGAVLNGNKATPTTAAGSKATGWGGALYAGPVAAGDAPTVTLNDSTVSGGGVGANAAVGGGVAVVGNVFAASGVTLPQFNAARDNFSGNTAFIGGALYGFGSIADSTFTANNATSAGAIDVQTTVAGESPVLTLTTSSVLSNTAVSGAGLVVTKGGTANLTGTHVDNNTATGTSNNGTGLGGGIYNAGTASLKGGTVSGNTANAGPSVNGGNGGGVFSPGVLTITNGTVLSGNHAITSSSPGSAASGWGGAVYVGPWAANDAPTATIDDATIAGGGVAPSNALVGGGVAVVGNVLAQAGAVPGQLTAHRDTFSANNGFVGGALYASGSSTVADSTFSTNGAGLLGGAIDVQSTVASETPSLTMTNSVLSSNTSFLGGALYVVEKGVATVDGGRFTDNTASSGSTLNGGDGGAVFNAGLLTLSHATLSGNKAIATTASGSSPRGTGFGGALYAGSSTANSAVKTTLIADTFNNNSAATGSAIVGLVPSGVAGVTNPISITNSTITGNSSAPGAGSVVATAPLTLFTSTLYGNTAASGSAGFYGVAGSSVSGSILGANGAANCGTGFGFVPPADGGYNLTDPGDGSCAFTGTQHDIFAAALLGPLAANGGPTETRMPGPSSPAINAVPPTTATGVGDAVSGAPLVLCAGGAVDQRGVVRPQGATCDIGAVEADLSAPVLSGPSAVEFTVGTGSAFAYSATGVPTPHLSLSGTLPAGVTFTDNGDGTASLAGAPAAGTGGIYNVTVTAANGTAPDASEAVTITVREAPTLNGPSADTYYVNHEGGPDTFIATGFPTPTLSMTGTLPAGVSFVPDGNGGASISGTPQPGTEGTYSVTITASNGTAPDATRTFNLVVKPAVSIVTTALPGGAVGVTYSATLVAQDGKSPYTWSVVAGALPAGLSLAPDGTISGVPSGPTGTFTFTVQVSDALDPPGVATREFSITIERGPTQLDIYPVVLRNGVPVIVKIGVIEGRLTGGNPSVGLGGQVVKFYAGTRLVCQTTTGADGSVRCEMSPANTTLVIANGGVRGVYEGSALWLPSEDSAGLAG